MVNNERTVIYAKNRMITSAPVELRIQLQKDIIGNNC